MFTGLTLLAWALGLSVLYLTWLTATAAHTPRDEEYARIDRELDLADSFYTDLEKEKRL